MLINKNLLLIFVLIILCSILSFIYIKDYFINFIHKKCEYDHPLLKAGELSDLEDLLLEFKRYAEENNIDYFPIGGTLIGTVRQGGLMPLDDDIDVGILEKSSKFFESYKNEEFYTESTFFGYKLYKNEYKGTKKTFIDIMIFEEKDGMLKIKGGSWDNESLHYDEIFPLLTAKYNDIDITIPNTHITYLNRAFPKWDTVMRPQCDHENNVCTYKDILLLPDELPFDGNNKYTCYSGFPSKPNV